MSSEKVRGRLDTAASGSAPGTGLCAPNDPGFQAWLERIRNWQIASCTGAPTAYLTQGVQSRKFPDPLVAVEKALLRVFVTAAHATTAGIPTVRAWFYLNGTETPVADTPAKATPIPTEVFRTRSISVRKGGNPCRDHTAGPRDGGQDRPGWNVGCRSRSLDANPRDRPCCSGSARDAWKSSRRPHVLLRKPLHLGASLGDPSGSGTAHFLPRFRRDAASAPALRIPSPPLQVDESRPGLPRPTLRSDSTPLTGLLGSALEAFAMSLAAPQGRLLALQGNL